MKIRTPISPTASYGAHCRRSLIAVIVVLILAHIGQLYLIVRRELVTRDLHRLVDTLVKRCPLPERLDQLVIGYSDGTCRLILVEGSNRHKKKEKRHA